MRRMHEVINQVERERDHLVSEPLFRWLSRDDIDGRERLSFAPAMLFYLMGFKDVLGALYRPNEETKLDRFINAYCGEDAEHWRWYLSDLEKLGYGLESWGATIPQFCNDVWSESTEANRRTIFRLIHASMSCDDPLFSLSLIMVFEATGVVFIGHTRKAAAALGMGDDLNYFGREHYEEEFGHSVSSKHLATYEMSDEVFKLTEDVVARLFADYRDLFNCWHQHAGRYEPIKKPA